MKEETKKNKMKKEARIDIRIAPDDKEMFSLRAKAVGSSLNTYFIEVLKMVNPEAIEIRQENVNELIKLSNCLEENDIEGAKGCVNKLWKNI